MSIDIAVGHKGLPRITLQEVEEHTIPSRHIPRKKKIFSSYPSVMSHFIDSEPPCLGRSNKRIGMERCHNRRITIYLKE
jgi:hypothetical protein